MSYRYLISLKPLGEFFFGSEQSFSKDDLRESSSFFAKSFMFMQQNSILGMLRREILRQKGKLKLHINGEWPDLPKKSGNDSKEWLELKELVGSEAFDFYKEIETGIIEEISEVFLKRDNEIYYQMPFDNDLTPEKTEIEVMFNGRKRKYIKFNIDQKEFENDFFISNNKKIKTSQIFIKSQSVGIKKNSEEEGFFQKTAYKIKEGFEFAFYLTLKEDIRLDGVVNIGGDGSSFVLKTEKVELVEPDFEKKDGFERIIFTSEAFLDEEIENMCDYVFAQNLIYRGVKSGKNKTKRARVLKRGSVLYVKDGKADEVEEKLKNSHLYKFGFNRFKRS